MTLGAAANESGPQNGLRLGAEKLSTPVCSHGTRQMGRRQEAEALRLSDVVKAVTALLPGNGH